MREPCVAPQRRVHAERNADHKCKQRSGGSELERGGQALLQQRRHGPSLSQRAAEIALERVADEMRELHDRRLVEAQLGAELRFFFHRCVLPDHEDHRVAGEIEQPECNQRHDPHDRDGLEDATQDEGEHVGRSRATAPWKADAWRR
jgi:hypothetical protein